MHNSALAITAPFQVLALAAQKFGE